MRTLTQSSSDRKKEWGESVYLKPLFKSNMWKYMVKKFVSFSYFKLWVSWLQHGQELECGMEIQCNFNFFLFPLVLQLVNVCISIYILQRNIQAWENYFLCTCIKYTLKSTFGKQKPFILTLSKWRSSITNSLIATSEISSRFSIYYIFKLLIKRFN